MQEPHQVPTIRQLVWGAASLASLWAFFASVAAPLALAAVGLVYAPPFLTDETYWWASVAGAAAGGLAGLIRGIVLARRRLLTGSAGTLAGGIAGLALVLVLGVPCSGIGGAIAGILFWTIHGGDRSS